MLSLMPFEIMFVSYNFITIITFVNFFRPWSVFACVSY